MFCQKLFTTIVVDMILCIIVKVMPLSCVVCVALRTLCSSFLVTKKTKDT